MRFILNRIVILLLCLFGTAASIYAQKTISGTVRDAQDAIVGASVTVIGNRQVGTITDMNGKFQLQVPNNAKEIQVSYVGYVTKNVNIAGSNKVDVTLTEDAIGMEEVVAIGYAKVKRRDLTAATVSVGGDQLTAPVTTAAQALTGKAAGVNVITQSGAPGADINITVRGGTSITQSTSPLYIVDGFIMDNGLQNVDINDIETIDVMKDASATAIYGSAGANGVILITTKSGHAGKTEVSYNAYWSFERLGKKLDVLNAADYVKYQYEFQTLAGKQSSWATMFANEAWDGSDTSFLPNVYSYIDQTYGNREAIDWQDEIFGGTALTQNHNATISGGNDKTKFMISYNYTGQDGLMSKHSYDKNNIRVKLNHEIRKFIRFDLNSSFSNSEVEGGGSLGGALKSTILQPATGGSLFTNEELVHNDVSDQMKEYDSQYDIYNPIITNDAVTQKKFTKVFNINAGLDIDFLKDFTFRTAYSFQWTDTRSDYWDDGRTQTAIQNGGPYGYRNNGEKDRWQWTNTLNWNHKYGDHGISGLLGYELTNTVSIAGNDTYRKFPDSNFGLNQTGMATEIISSSSKSKGRKSSVFARASYNYQDKYLVNGTVRGDGTSKFSRDNQWGFFPSISGAWRITEENFIKDNADLSFIDNLKLRVGYGVSGNDNVDNNMYSTDYSSSHVAINDTDVSTLVPSSTLGNKNLKWEKTATTNIGLDIAVLNNRLSLSIDWYNNKSNDLIIKNKIPSSTGYSYQYQNVGSVRNRGVEVVLHSLDIKKKDFTWSTDFNIAFNRSKVLAIYGNGGDDYFIQNVDSRIDYMIKVGQPLGQFYGYKYDGVYTTDDFTQNEDGSYTLKDGVPSLKGKSRSSIKPGDVKYQCTAGEVDKDGNPVWSTSDRTVIGNAQPKFTGGLNNTFTYKGFDMSIFMNFSVGNKLFNMSSQRFIGPYLANQNTMTVMNSRFVLVDPATGSECKDLNRLAELNPGQYSKDAMWSLNNSNKIAITDALDYYLEDGSYLRLSQITLGYSFPKQWLKNVYLNKARVYMTLNNIYTFTNYSGYDPEVSSTSSILTQGIDSSSYPRSKSFVIGFQLNF